MWKDRILRSYKKRGVVAVYEGDRSTYEIIEKGADDFRVTARGVGGASRSVPNLKHESLDAAKAWVERDCAPLPESEAIVL